MKTKSVFCQIYVNPQDIKEFHQLQLSFTYILFACKMIFKGHVNVGF